MPFKRDKHLRAKIVLMVLGLASGAFASHAGVMTLADGQTNIDDKTFISLAWFIGSLVPFGAACLWIGAKYKELNDADREAKEQNIRQDGRMDAHDDTLADHAKRLGDLERTRGNP